MNEVRVGVEWINVFHHDSVSTSDHRECEAPDLPYMNALAEDFLLAMRSYGHQDIFDWGNDNAWSSDFNHPDFGGDSLNWSDNVHFCYFAGHTGQSYPHTPGFNIGFSSRHNPPSLPPCRSMTTHWKLGAKRLKWFAIDGCYLVTSTTASHILDTWSGPMQGIHLILGFINLNHIWPDTHNRRISFAYDICRGRPIANAWLDWAYFWRDDLGTRPIAIAAGFTRDEAIARREGENLNWLWYNVRETDWLAWKWRD
jgi:hypothetical protein